MPQPNNFDPTDAPVGKWRGQNLLGNMWTNKDMAN